VRKTRTTAISILAVGLLAGSTIGAAAQDEPAIEATEVTGKVTFGEPISMPQGTETPEGIIVTEGVVANTTWDASDDRLDGDGTYSVNASGPLDGPSIALETYELTNDGGSWIGDGRAYSGESGRTGFVTLSGRDGYEGLSAYVVTEFDGQSAWDLRGVIFPSEMLPEVPEPFVVDQVE
jgi:hypothetical protein